MNDATKKCEEILREEKRYNTENQILPSQNKVIDRLLDRRAELVDAYTEIHEKLRGNPVAMGEILRTLTETGAIWGRSEIQKARNAARQLNKVNEKISQKSLQLAALLKERSELEKCSSFSAHNLCHIGDVIEAASDTNPLFNQYLREPLDGLRYRFDFKYWPSLEECCYALSDDATHSKPEATNAITGAATSGHSGLSDAFKALLQAIAKCTSCSDGIVPERLRLTDETIASLGNCILDLSPEELVAGSYVKRLRQRERNKSRSQ